ncbi:type 2 lanthipeptide synthetase LanM family protein [Kitasatospora sp. NPDC088351]|uniref:type 2 lanthipeptide synthetase LanM family protein n=1 Tax=Kitasatospora sp. NPDC088351 TaxID=3155180 RepID=UPI003448F577
MTDTATPPDTRTPTLPRWWWARGLTLRERLATPGLPVAGPAAAPGRGPGPWSAGDRAGFAARLASLGLGDGQAFALGDELPDRLAARSAKPRWARYVERTVAGAPVTAGAPEQAHGEGVEVFLPVLRPLITQAWAGVAARLPLPEGEHAAVRAAFEQRLGHQLVRRAARTLVRELSEARAEGRLTGATGPERFAAFTAELGTGPGLSRLFTRYPVLARILGGTAADAAEAVLELAERLHTDRAALVAGLFRGEDPGALVRLELGRGDAHQGNRSVALLHFADGGAVVYKPRPLGQHALLDEAVGWLNGKVAGLGLRTPRSVRGAGYGWLEFVEHHWCGSVTAADRFYRRQGALLALLYAVDGADMHYENVIASGDQPVLVDAETLFHTGLPAATTAGADPAAGALEASVHRTCLLPNLLIGENGALDISALGRADSGAYPSDGLRWEDAGTDTMRAVRGPVESPAGQNQPLPQGRTAGHADHRAALLEGFRAGYDAITAHRAELLGTDGLLCTDGLPGAAGALGTDGLLGRWAHTPARLLVRSTRLYTTLLDESTHPDLLHDALARDSVFAVLWTESADDPARQRLIEHEIAELWRGDVPLFFHRPGRTAVWTGRDVRVDGILPVPSLVAVQGKIAAMDEVDRHDQEWVISATLAVSSANSPDSGPRSELAPVRVPAVVPESPRLLAAACGIADEITARAVHGDGRANWLGLERVAGAHWAVLPMGGGLAQGYCGVALFLAQTGALAGAPRYTALAREAVRPLPALLSALVTDPELSAAVGPGALNGLGGIVHTLLRLTELLGGEGDRDGVRAELDGCLSDALTALAHAADALPDGPGATGPVTGLADGLAGALAAVLPLCRATGDRRVAERAAEQARRLADRLLALTGAGSGATGLAHGDAGTGWALLRYAAVRGEAGGDGRPYATAGAALLRPALDAAVRAGAGGDLSWYSGLAGVALAAADTLTDAAVADDALADGFDHCVRLLSAPGGSDDLSLGHGTLGALEALTVLAERGHPGARDALIHRTGEVLGLIEQQGHRCATPDHVPSPGLLTGLSGIGYALLRLGFPGTVPSVLLLDHAPRATSGPHRTTR